MRKGHCELYQNHSKPRDYAPRLWLSQNSHKLAGPPGGPYHHNSSIVESRPCCHPYGWPYFVLVKISQCCLSAFLQLLQHAYSVRHIIKIFCLLHPSLPSRWGVVLYVGQGVGDAFNNKHRCQHSPLHCNVQRPINLCLNGGAVEAVPKIQLYMIPLTQHIKTNKYITQLIPYRS